MGYRHYFVLINKEIPEKIKDMKKKDFFDYVKTLDKAGYEPANEYCPEDVDIHEFIRYMKGKEIFEFGKYYENAEALCALGHPMFSDTKIQEDMYSDYGLYIVGKDAVLNAIEYYRTKVVSYYQGLLITQEEAKKKFAEGDYSCYESLKDTREERLVCEAKKKISEWSTFKPYDLNENNENIVSSWLYEYEVFELVRLLKTIDWEKNCLIFYGY